MNAPEAIALLERERDLMTAVATGESRIQEVNEAYQSGRRTLAVFLAKSGIEDPNTFPDLWLGTIDGRVEIFPPTSPAGITCACFTLPSSRRSRIGRPVAAPNRYSKQPAGLALIAISTVFVSA